VPVTIVKDPNLLKGKRVVESGGSPPLATSVHRVVYGANGKVMYDSTWSSDYDAVPSVVRLGTKPAKKKKAPKPDATANPAAEQPAEPTAPPPLPQPR
jgi:hypothetical protein